MLCWSITIYAMEPTQHAQARVDERQAAMLVHWETSLEQTEWLTVLVEQIKIEQRLTGGYPDQYVGRARDILPLLAQVIPYHSSSGRRTVSHAEKIAACHASQVLTIQVWDLT